VWQDFAAAAAAACVCGLLTAMWLVGALLIICHDKLLLHLQHLALSRHGV
jgi:hypothetical protein